MPAQKLVFVAPFSMETCKTRLQNLDEPKAMLASSWQTRLIVKLTQLTPDQLDFTIRMGPKSATQLDLGLSPIIVHGKLTHISLNETEVIAALEYQIIGLIGYWIFACIVAGGIAYIWTFVPLLEDVELPVLYGAAIVAFFVVMAIAWSIFRQKRVQLMDAVRRNLL